MQNTVKSLPTLIGFGIITLTVLIAPALANRLSTVKLPDSVNTGKYSPGQPRLLAATSTTPEGSVIITQGTLKDVTVNYSDPRGKHTRFPKYTQAQLEQAIKKPSDKREQDLVDAIKAKDTATYGSQLNSVAISEYANLVKNAVEKGTLKPRRSDMYFHEASFAIGIDVITGKSTKKYRIDSVPNGTHIIPVEYNDKDLK
jgi:hypothetical protein